MARGDNILKIRFKSDLRLLDKLERVIGDRVEYVCEQAAEALAADIKRNWSSSAPSFEGFPPAVVTGNLDSAVEAAPQGRSEGGQFAKSEDARIWFVTIDTEEGIDPNGRGQYAGILEHDYKRPFVEPAIERLSEIFPGMFSKVFDTT
jgi:hypothetical protein